MTSDQNKEILVKISTFVTDEKQYERDWFVFRYEKDETLADMIDNIGVNRSLITTDSIHSLKRCKDENGKLEICLKYAQIDEKNLWFVPIETLKIDDYKLTNETSKINIMLSMCMGGTPSFPEFDWLAIIDYLINSAQYVVEIITLFFIPKNIEDLKKWIIEKIIKHKYECPQLNDVIIRMRGKNKSWSLSEFKYANSIDYDEVARFFLDICGFLYSDIHERYYYSKEYADKRQNDISAIIKKFSKNHPNLEKEINNIKIVNDEKKVSVKMR